MYHQDNTYYLEPYYLTCFASQFRYDQLYIGNLNPNIKSIGNLFEGARAWYYFVGGCIITSVCLKSIQAPTLFWHL